MHLAFLRWSPRCASLGAILLIAAFGSEARADLIITPTFEDNTVPNSVNATDFHNAVYYTIGEFEHLFSDPIHINITFSFSGTGLGASNTELFGSYSYGAIKTALQNDQTAHPSAAGAISVANLPNTDPTSGGNFFVATAQAKALGLIADNMSQDGSIEFSNAQPYTFDPNNRQIAGKYDFIGVAEHEISEVMGRIPILGGTVDSNPPTPHSYTPNDLFRFTAPGTPNQSSTATGVYFSIDNGTTNLVNFNSVPGEDLQDYRGDNPTDPFNASTGANQGHRINGVDITNLDVIGYDLNLSPVPEPATLTLIGVGIVSLAGYGLRRRNWVAV